ncbi:Phage tail-collar fiber protein [Candidatus Hepatincola sp. Pdp]
MSFEIVYTDKGLEKLVLAENGTPLVLEKFAVGDGENAPETSQIGLQNEKWRGYINKVEPSSTTPTNLLITCVIPAQIPITEAFYIRELGLFDIEEELIAIAKVPDSYYAQSSNGIASEKLYNIVLSISNTAEVTLELDTTILATQESVKELEDTIAELNSNLLTTQASLTDLHNIFITSLKTQIGKIIINMDPKYKDIGIWNDGVFGYVICNGRGIDSSAYPDLAAIYGTNVPNFKDGTVRNLITGSSRALGSWEDDALQNITGWADGIDINNQNLKFSGALYWGTDGQFRTGNDAADQSTPRLHFDASKVARTADETRMKNIAVQFYVIAKVLI